MKFILEITPEEFNETICVLADIFTADTEPDDDVGDADDSVISDEDRIAAARKLIDVAESILKQTSPGTNNGA